MTSEPSPLVRVLHFSDIHFCHTRPHSVYLRRLLDGAPARGLLGHARQPLKQGLAGHSSRALHELRRSVLDFVGRQASMWADKTHLVCTGDLSTWGDDASLGGARQFIQALARDAALSAPPCVLYGNHDVWPANPGHLRGIPLLCSQAKLDTRRSEMRKQHFPGSSWLKSHVTSTGSPRVGLCAINTVEHARWQNTLAQGEVKADWYWEKGSCSPCQLDELERWLGDVDVALVFSHHPVYDEQYHGPAVRRSGSSSSTPPPRSGLRHSPVPVSVIPPPTRRF